MVLPDSLENTVFTQNISPHLHYKGRLIKNDNPFMILSRATYPGAPSYGGMRTWVVYKVETLNL